MTLLLLYEIQKPKSRDKEIRLALYPRRTRNLKMKTTMKHTYETALAAAINRGYRGEYANLVAADWVGRTPEEIAADSADFNSQFLRREKYARAAAIESSPARRSYLEGQAGV